MIGSERTTPSSSKSNVPLSGSVKVKVADPTRSRMTFAGSQGWLLNGGPSVWYRSPDYWLLPVWRPSDMDSHRPLPVTP